MFDKAAIYVYLGAFSLLIAAGLGFPIPEELPIVTAGAMVGHASEYPSRYDSVSEVVAVFSAAPGAPFPVNLPWAALEECLHVEPPPPPPPRVRLLWQVMLPVLILGVVISDSLLYGMGRFWGPKLLQKSWMRRLLPPEKRQRIEENFHKYGVLVLLFARFLPTIRAPIFIMAGTMRLPFARFVMADGLYAIPGVSLLFFLAFWFGDQFRDLVLAAEGRVASLRPVLILIALAGVGAYLLFHFLRHPVATGDPKDELPVIGPQFAAKMDQAAEGETWTALDGSKRINARNAIGSKEGSASAPQSPDSASGMGGI
ncbi:MAG TPA: DedA family protein [Gemmataceae bacterium]|nr:DedA family protein [Gemmataceae bacterium]